MAGLISLSQRDNFKAKGDDEMPKGKQSTIEDMDDAIPF
jgi:hypothetical protein